MRDFALAWAREYLSSKGQSLSGFEERVGRTERMVLVLHTVQGRRYVLKVDARAAGLAPEAENATLLYERGCPVLAPEAYVDGPPSFLLRAYQEGQSLGKESTAAQRRLAGQLLRRIHNVGGGKLPPGNQSWREWMRGWLQSVWAYWLSKNPGISKHTQQVASWFDDLSPVLDGRGSQLILMDGRPEHFLVTPSGIELIDVADMRAGDAWMDLAVIWLWGREVYPDFLEGYAPDESERQAGVHLLPFYAFLRALSAAQWCEHGPEHLVQPFLSEAEAIAATFV